MSAIRNTDRQAGLPGFPFCIMNAREFVEKFGVHYDADAGELRDKDDNEVDINDNCLQDYACPECGDRGCFSVEVKGYISLCDSGIDGTHGDDEYDGDSYTSCCDCDHSGEMRSFHISGLDNLLQEIYDNGQEAAEADEEDPTLDPAPEPETSSTTPPPTPPIGWDTSGIQ